MTANLEKKDGLPRLGFASIIFSEVHKENWRKTDSYLKHTFENNGLITILIIKIFGKNELWVVFKYSDPKDLDKLEDEQFFRYSALLGKYSFNKKVADGITQKDKVAYLFIKRKPIKIERIKKGLKAVGGVPFLIGDMHHPHGYSHAILFKTKKTKILAIDNAVSLFTKNLGVKEYECVLASRHEWIEAKAKTTSHIKKLSRGLYEAADWTGTY